MATDSLALNAFRQEIDNLQKALEKLVTKARPELMDRLKPPVRLPRHLKGRRRG